MVSGNFYLLSSQRTVTRAIKHGFHYPSLIQYSITVHPPPAPLPASVIVPQQCKNRYIRNSSEIQNLAFVRQTLIVDFSETTRDRFINVFSNLKN